MAVNSRFIKGILALSSTVFITSFYRNVYRPSALAAMGIGILSFMLFYGLAELLYRHLYLPFSNKHCLCFLFISVAYGIFSFALPQYAYSRLFLDILSVFMLAMLAGMALHYYPSVKSALPVLLLLSGAMLAFLYFWYNIGCFSPDSYSYFDIAKTFFHDFGRVSTIRQYVVPSDYNISFPFFYPFCLFVINTFTGLGLYSGVYLNFFIMLYTVALLLVLSKRFCNKAYPGALAGFLLLFNVYYLDEVCAARSIPLTLLLVLILFGLSANLYLKDQTNRCSILLIGFLAGLSMGTRFDQMVLVLFLALGIFFLAPGNKVQNLFLYLLAAAVALFPWALYSWLHFKTLWISDNLGTWFYIETMVPSRVIIPGSGFETMFTAPLSYIQSLLYRIFSVGGCLVLCSIPADFIILFSLIHGARKLKLLLQNKKSFPGYGYVFILLILFYCAKTTLYMLTGYVDIRYHIETALVFSFAVMLLNEQLGVKYTFLTRKIVPMLTVSLLLLGCFYFQAVFPRDPLSCSYSPLSGIGAQPSWICALESELDRNGIPKEAPIFMLTSDAFEYGCITGRKTYVPPDNLSPETVAYALDYFVTADYILLPRDSNQELQSRLSAQFETIALSEYFLFSCADPLS